MKTHKFILQLGLVAVIAFGCSQCSSAPENKQANCISAKRTWDSSKNDTIESEEEKRFYKLTQNLQQKYESGKIEEVESIIRETKRILPNFERNWNYGNEVHKINIVAGRIALQNGNVEEAKKYLILAGQTNGSPQLNSFGPNMSLAKELLEKKESKVVLQYFDLCSRFWECDFSKLDNWKELVKKGKIPEFGANLVF
jgi:hypothetical protein